MKYSNYKLLQNYVHRDYSMQKNIILRELELHKSNSTADLRVFELACGDGNLAGIFSPSEYIGTDLSQERISIARKNYPGYTFLSGDVTSREISEKFADANFIFCHGLLHHLDDEQCRNLLECMRGFAGELTTFVAIEALLPKLWRNPLGFILAKLDEGSFIRTASEYQRLLADNLVRSQYLDFFPRWPVNEQVFTLNFSREQK